MIPVDFRIRLRARPGPMQMASSRAAHAANPRRLRIHRSVFTPEFLARPDDPQRDFAAIGDEDFLEHPA